MTDAKITRQCLKDQIRDILINRIVEGDLKPGDRLKELQIAKELGTSQAPVREAIRCLESLGYIEHIPHVGAMVRTFDRHEIEEAYQVREALEVHAVNLINDEVGPLVEELEACLEDMKIALKDNNIRSFTKADNRFHHALVYYTRNETMMKMWESLKMQLQVIATLVDVSMPLSKIISLHPQIVENLKCGQYEKASGNLKTHYQVIGNYWKELKGKKA